MAPEIKQRMRWIELYEQTGNAGLVCLKCGISRPTLRLWWQRYQEQEILGLASHSSRPHTSPAKKTFEVQEQWIAQLRKRRLGARRIQSELLRQHDCSLSLATIHKVLLRQQQPLLKTSRRPRHTVHRYDVLPERVLILK